MADELPPPDAPQAQRLTHARAAAEGVHEGRACWETLAARGVIPMDWIGDDNRAFALRTRDGEARRAMFPPLPAACVAMASDPEGVLAAEALAREISALFGMPRERVCWFLQPGARVRHELMRLPEPHPPGVRERLQQLGRLGYALGAIERGELVMFAPAERAG